MATPRIEVGCIGLDVFVVGTQPVRVENEFVWGEKEATVGAFDAFGAR